MFLSSAFEWDQLNEVKYSYCIKMRAQITIKNQISIRNVGYNWLLILYLLCACFFSFSTCFFEAIFSHRQSMSLNRSLNDYIHWQMRRKSKKVGRESNIWNSKKKKKRMIEIPLLFFYWTSFKCLIIDKSIW